MSQVLPASAGRSATTPSERERLEDIGYMTCMTLTLLGNYAQTGHFGGPTAYTPFNVATHLAGPASGGLRFDYRRPKHPYSDKFMLAAGHCAPTCYALWMIMGEAMYRRHQATGDRRYRVAPDDAMLSVDALGFRRGAGALKTLLADQGLADHALFAQAKGRGIRSLSGHIESTDVTNDVNGGPSGIGIATAAGKAAFWDFIGAPPGSPKVIAFEGEFAMCAGHAQELKTQAIALQVGKRLRIFFSDNNAGIDDALIGGVVSRKFDGYRLMDQWTSYGWNVFSIPDGHDYDQIVRVLRDMEEWDPRDRRPMIVFGKTIKGYWPGAVNGKLSGRRPDRRVSEPSLRFQDELGLLRRARPDLRAALRGEVRRDPRRSRDRPARAPDPVQDEHRRGDVRARPERPRGMAGRSPRRDRGLADGRPQGPHQRPARSVPGRAAPREEPAGGAADPDGDERAVGRGEAGQDRAVPEGRRGRRGAPGHLGDREVAELRHREPRADAGRRPLRVGEPGARQPLGALRPRHEPARHPPEGRDPGSRQRVDGDRPGEPERVGRSRQVRRRLGVQRHLRRVHAAHVPAGPRLEPAEPGQQVPHRRAPHPGGALRPRDGRRRPYALRDLRAPGVEALPARAGHSPELLGLQRRGAGLLRGGGDRRAREEGRRDRHRGGAARLQGRGPDQVRGPGRPRRREGALRHPGLRAGPAPPRLRGGAGVERHVQPGERPAAPRGGRDQREGHRRHQRGPVRPAARRVPARGPAAGGEAGSHVRHVRHAPHVAAPERRAAHRRLLADGRLGQSVADGRARGGRHRRGPPGRRRRSWRASRGSPTSGPSGSRSSGAS